MIHDASVKLQKQHSVYIKKMFRARLRTHYKYVLKNLKIIFNYWGIYLYVFIGLLAGALLLHSLISTYAEDIQYELHSIYLSIIFFLISIQFSIKYFFDPADSIHFRQRKEIILKIRKYAVTHAVFYQSFTWGIIFVSISQLFFLISNKDVVCLVCLYFFTVSFTLAICIIRKEPKFYLREQHRKIYPYLSLLVTITFHLWYVIIFCFADELYILVGTFVNLLIFIYAYNWGSSKVMSTLSYLIDSDKRQNMLSVAIVGYLPQYDSHMKQYRTKPLLLKRSSLLFNTENYKVVLIEILGRRLLRSSSYLATMVMLYIVSSVGIYNIKTTLQFALVGIVTFYISFLIHKQHVDYFNANMLMKSNIKQGLDVKFTDVKLTFLLTTPVIILMYLVFITFR